MSEVVGFEKVEDRGRTRDGFAILRILGVENAQRVVGEALLRVLAEVRLFRLEVGAKGIPVARARSVATERIHAYFEVFDAERAEDPDEHVDHFGVHAGPRIAVNLGSCLPELTIATALGLLGAKHRAEVVEAAHGLLRVERVADVSPRDAGRAFGAQRDRLVTALEREHLLFDDLGRVTDRAHEEVERLEERGPDLGIARALELAPQHGLELVPAPDFVGQDVVHALDGPESHGSGVVAYPRGGGSGQAHGPRKASKCASPC